MAQAKGGKSKNDEELLSGHKPVTAATTPPMRLPCAQPSTIDVTKVSSKIS